MKAIIGIENVDDEDTCVDLKNMAASANTSETNGQHSKSTKLGN